MFQRLARQLAPLLVLLAVARPASAITTTLTGYVVASTPTVDPRTVQPVSTPAGETGTINVAVRNLDGSAYDLTGAQVQLVVRDKFNVVVLSRQATINSPSTAGTAYFPIVVADLLPRNPTNGAALLCTYDVFVTDASGNRFQVVPSSRFSILPAQTLPTTPVTVPPSQTPLAQGPQGVPGLGLSRTAQTGNYSARLLDYVAANCAANCTTTLPPTSSLTVTSGNIVYVKNIGTTGSVTVAPSGLDIIDIGTIALAPGEVLPVIAHAGAWEALQ